MLALGAVVDDAVADVDRIARRLRRHRADGGDASAARVVLVGIAGGPPAGRLRHRDPAGGGRAGVLHGGPDRRLPPAPGAVASGWRVLASMLVALTVTPVLGLLLLAGAPVERRQPPLARWLAAGYRRAAGPGAAHPRPGHHGRGRGAGRAAARAGRRAARLDQDLAPSFRDTDLLVRLNGAPGTSHPEMTRVTALAGRELRAIPGVENVGAHVGRAIMSDQVGRRQLGRAVGQRRPGRRLRPDRGRRAGGGRRLPRDGRRAAHLPRAADRAGPGRRRRRPRGPRLRPGPGGAAGQGRGGPAAARRRRRHRRPAGRAAGRGADPGDRGRPGQGAARRDQAGRRPPGRRHPAVGHPGRQPVRGAEGLRRGRLGRPPRSAAASPTSASC